MRHGRYGKLLTASCVLTLCALALIVWSVLDPRPIPVVLAMSLGQVIGTLSLATFFVVVIADIRARLSKKVLDRTE